MRAIPLLLAFGLSFEAVGCATTSKDQASPGSLAPQVNWLVGTWQGKLGGNFRGKPERTFEVFDVLPSGAAQGTFSVTGLPSYAATIRWAEPVVTVVTAANSYVELTRRSPDELAGSFRLANGQTFPIALTRVNDPLDATRLTLARELVGKWEGAVDHRWIPGHWGFGGGTPGRTLIIDLVTLEEGRCVAKGRYGMTGRGLGQTTIEISYSGRNPSIRFVTGWSETIRLDLLGGRHLVGSVEYPAAGSYFSPGNAETLRLERVEQAEKR